MITTGNVPTYLSPDDQGLMLNVIQANSRFAGDVLRILRQHNEILSGLSAKIALSSGILSNPEIIFSSQPELFHILVNREFLLADNPINTQVLLQDLPQLKQTLINLFPGNLETMYIH